MGKYLKGLVATATLLWAGTAAAAIELTMVADLTYRSDDPDPGTPPVITYFGPQKIVLEGDSWEERFYLTADYSPSSCYQVQDWGNGCFVAEFADNTLNFWAPELGGFYQSFGISLKFDRNVELDRNLSLAKLVSGSYAWSSAHHGYSTSVTGPVLSLSVPEPATWAMMLIGFGGIGAAMRRRSSPTADQTLAA